jgi:hypothetical protein
MLLNGHGLKDILNDFNLFTEKQLVETYGITRPYIMDRLDESTTEYNKSQSKEDREKAFWDVDQLCMLLVKIAETSDHGHYVYYVAPPDEVARQFGLTENKTKAAALNKWREMNFREFFQVATTETISGDTLEKLIEIYSKRPMSEKSPCCYAGLRAWVTLKYIESVSDKESINKYDWFYPKCPWVSQVVQERMAQLPSRSSQTPPK